MQTLFDIPTHESEITLLEELKAIDAAYAEGEVTPEQERRGGELVELCNSAELLRAEVKRLSAEVDMHLRYTRFLEKERRTKAVRDSAYKGIDAIYRTIKEAAEGDAQAPIDEQFRQCLYGLQAIKNDQDACNCNVHGWHGEGHHIQCPVGIAIEAQKRALAPIKEMGKPLYIDGKGGTK